MARRKSSYASILLICLVMLSMLVGCGQSATSNPSDATSTSAVAGAPGSSATAIPSSGEGFTASHIFIGQTIALSGPLSSAGLAVSGGAKAYFSYINDNGGVNGRKIAHKVFDDGYQPQKTVEGAKRLVEEDKVLLLYQGMGTAPQKAVIDYLTDKKVPHLFHSSGDSVFGGDIEKYPYTVPGVIPYRDEGSILTRYMLSVKPNAKLGIIYQNDDMGKQYILGVTDALGEKAASVIVAKQSFEVTAADVTSQIQNLKQAGADTMLIVSTPKAAAQSITAADTANWKPLVLMANPGVSQATFDAINVPLKEGVISGYFYKDPTDPGLANDPGLKLYVDIMVKYFPEGNPKDVLSLGGMAWAYTLVEVLKDAGANPTRENVMKAIERMDISSHPFMQNGIRLKCAADDHIPLQEIQMIKYEKGRFSPFGPVVKLRD